MSIKHEKQLSKVLQLGDAVQVQCGELLFEGHVSGYTLPENMTADPITGFVSWDNLELDVSVNRVTKVVA